MLSNAQNQSPSPDAELLKQLMRVTSGKELDRVVASRLAKSLMNFNDRVQAHSAPLNRISAVESVEELDSLLSNEPPQDH